MREKQGKRPPSLNKGMPRHDPMSLRAMESRDTGAETLHFSPLPSGGGPWQARLCQKTSVTLLRSQLQQVSAAAAQLPSPLRRGHALGEPPEDEHEHRGAVVRPLERGPGPGVEDPSTRRAPVVEDGLSRVPMDDEPLVRMTPGAMQSLRVEHVEE